MNYQDQSTRPRALDGERPLRLKFLALAGATIATWATAPWWISHLWRGLGYTGGLPDMYEAVGALFSGLAFVGLLAALGYQRRDLRLQRRELRFQRRELQYQREELAAAVAAQEDSARALEERLRQEEIHAHQRLCVDLLKEWHTGEMQHSRDLVDQRIHESCRVGGRTLPRLEPCDDTEEPTPEVFSVFRILHFFEKLADLVEAGLVEVPLASRLLGRYLEYWESSLFSHLRDDDPSPLHRAKLEKIARLSRDFRSAELGRLPVAPIPESHADPDSKPAAAPRR